MTVNNLIRLVPIILLIFGCQKKTYTSHQRNENLLIADIVGDKRLDSVVTFEDNEGTSVCLRQNNRDTEIIKITPLIDSTFNSAKTKIENVFLMPNAVQTDEKGLRVMVRNTDLSPDCCFIDLKFKQKWVIEYVGIINSIDSVFIKRVQINLPVDRTDNSHNYNLKGLALENINIRD